jgi:hypothetical protein
MNGIKIIERGQGSDVLKRHCRQIGVPVEIIRRLVQAELDQVGRGRRHGLWAQFDEILAEVTEGASDVSKTDSAA